MKTPFLLLTSCLGLLTFTLIAQDTASQPPPPPPERGGDPLHIHLLPRGADEALNLTADQRKQLTALETESRTKIEAILTPEQFKKLTALRPTPRAGDRPNDRPPASEPRAETASAAPVPAAPPVADKPLSPGVSRQPVTFSGGHETVPVDGGRPVVLIAAALGVKDEVFREAFSHVHPAGPGSNGPTEAEARTNKQALMSRLESYGITNDRLNTVSNFYRYASWKGDMWKNESATANALVKDGAIVGFEIVSGGYGYTTPPSVSVRGFPSANATVELAFGKNFQTNGSISAITPGRPR